MLYNVFFSASRRKKDIFLPRANGRQQSPQQGAGVAREEMKKVTTYLYGILALSLVLSLVMTALGIVNSQTAEAAVAVYTPSATLSAEATAMAQPAAAKSDSAVQTPVNTDGIADRPAPEENAEAETSAASETPEPTAASAPTNLGAGLPPCIAVASVLWRLAEPAPLPTPAAGSSQRGLHLTPLNSKRSVSQGCQAWILPADCHRCCSRR